MYPTDLTVSAVVEENGRYLLGKAHTYQNDRRNRLPSLGKRGETSKWVTLYALLGVWIALNRQSYGSLPFLLLCTAGIGYTAILSLQDVRKSS